MGYLGALHCLTLSTLGSPYVTLPYLEHIGQADAVAAPTATRMLAFERRTGERAVGRSLPRYPMTTLWKTISPAAGQPGGGATIAGGRASELGDGGSAAPPPSESACGSSDGRSAYWKRRSTETMLVSTVMKLLSTCARAKSERSPLA